MPLPARASHGGAPVTTPKTIRRQIVVRIWRRETSSGRFPGTEAKEGHDTNSSKRDSPVTMWSPSGALSSSSAQSSTRMFRNLNMLIGAAREIRTPDPLITKHRLAVFITDHKRALSTIYLDISTIAADFGNHKRSCRVVGCFPYASRGPNASHEGHRRLTLPARGQGRLILFDDDLRFGIRLRSGGRRTWVAQYRIGTKQRRVTLGTIETIDADEARPASAALSKVQSRDRSADRESWGARSGGGDVRKLGRHLSLPLCGDAAQAGQFFSTCAVTLRVHWAPLHRSPSRSHGADVAARLAHIAEENGGFAANRARAALGSLYAWAIGEGLTDANPVVGTHKTIEEIARDRVLTDGELGLIWRHAGDGDYGAIVRLLILTGQRREEVGAMRWEEVDLKAATWRIAGERTKNARPHEVPLSQTALAILGPRARVNGRALVFGSRGPFSGWSKGRAALDARCRCLRFASPWRLHDVRRTVATRMADLGVQPHVIEAVLNHISGHKAGVVGVYNRAIYAAEKRRRSTCGASHVATRSRGVSRTSCLCGVCDERRSSRSPEPTTPGDHSPLATS